jgi:hypothetical protein
MRIGKNNRRRKRHASGRSVLGRRAPKSKRTFSLSPEALAYLDTLAKDYPSVSEALDVLIQGQKQQEEKERSSASIRHYYDAIGDEEREENRAWGEFVAASLAEE